MLDKNGGRPNGEHPEDIRTRRREVDEDGGKQAKDSRRRGRQHVERKTVKYLKTLERTEGKKESEETLEVVELG